MKKLNRTGTFGTVVAGALVLAVFGTGSAVAGSMITSSQIKDNTIRSVDVQNGALRSLDLRDNAVGSIDVRDGSLSGVDVRDGSLANADVNVFAASAQADGTKGPNSGNVAVTNTGVGSYIVDFGRNVAGCVATATIGSTTSAVEVHGEADVTAQLFNPEAFHVYTRTAGSATLTDLPFAITAVC